MKYLKNVNQMKSMGLLDIKISSFGHQNINLEKNTG